MNKRVARQTNDPASGQFIKRIAYHQIDEFRRIFKNMSDDEFEALVAQIRAHPVD